MVVPLAPVRVPSQRPLAPSVTSSHHIYWPNDKGENEMILGAVNRSPDIYLMTEENPGKIQLGDFLMKNVTSQH